MSGKKVVDAAEPILQITVECSRKSHLVHINEPFEFIISANRKQKLKAVISTDGETVLQTVTVTPPARIAVSLPQPGFVRCTVSSSDPDVQPVLCGVGVDPDQLRPLLPEPSDFDEFWDNTKKELAAVPADFKMKRIGTDKTFNYYQISCANINSERTYALLSLPVDASKKMPLLVKFSGGEAYIGEETIFEPTKEILGFECATLFFQLPPYPPVKKFADAKARHEKFLKKIGMRRYCYYGLEDRNKFYARTAVAGYLRLLDETLKQPGLDPKKVGYYGASHGGGFVLYLTGGKEE